jgi:hypothetical protein
VAGRAWARRIYEQGDWAGALNYYRSNLGIAQALAQRDPASVKPFLSAQQFRLYQLSLVDPHYSSDVGRWTVSYKLRLSPQAPFRRGLPRRLGQFFPQNLAAV